MDNFEIFHASWITFAVKCAMFDLTIVKKDFISLHVKKLFWSFNFFLDLNINLSKILTLNPLWQIMMTPNMQGIIMAIGKSRNVYDRCGPEAGFFKV